MFFSESKRKKSDKKQSNKKKLHGRSRRLLCLLGAAAMSITLLGGCRSLRDKDAELSYRQKGIAAMAVGQYEDAISYFQKGLDQSVGGIHDLEIDICLYKAEALYLAGRIDEAEALYSALIDYNDMADAYYLRGNLRFANGEREQGCQDFAEATRRDKNNYALYIGIYETMEKFGMPEEGEAYLNEALTIKGDDAEKLMQKGRVYYLLGDYESAMDTLAASIQKGSKEASFYMSQVYSAVGDFEESDRYFGEYMESGIADAQKLMSIGENRLNAGDYSAALKYLKGAEELGTIPEAGKQQLQRDLIAAYEYNRRYEEAYEQAASYVKAYPNDFDAEKELTFLKTRCKITEDEEESTEGE